MRIKKGDKVKILCGKDRGKTGAVLKCFPVDEKLLVEKVNLIKKHRKARGRNEQSERVSVEAPMNASNVQLICNKCNKPTRVGMKFIDKKKVRVCKKCNAEI